MINSIPRRINFMIVDGGSNLFEVLEGGWHHTVKHLRKKKGDLS